MSNDVIFWTQITTIVGFIIALFTLYGILVKSKDATIELLRERLTARDKELEVARATGPDLLAEKYSKRVNLLTEELKRLSRDEENNKTIIEQKELELREVEALIVSLRNQIQIAKDVMEEFLCPRCSAPMLRRDFQTQLVEHNGRDIDIEHEETEFECGLTIVNGKEVVKCSESET